MELLKTGTTTLGLIYKDGVILVADKKATLGYLVESKNSQKIYKLDEHIALTIAGGAGDAQSLVRLLRAQFNLYKLDRGPITVKAAATLLSNILQGSKYFPYMVQLLMAGYDSKPGLYSIDAVGAYDSKDNFYSTGSGSPMAYGVLEAEYKKGMVLDDALKLALKAAKAAVQRDIASGGNGFAVFVITKDGCKELSEQEIKKFV